MDTNDPKLPCDRCKRRDWDKCLGARDIPAGYGDWPGYCDAFEPTDEASLQDAILVIKRRIEEVKRSHASLCEAFKDLAVKAKNPEIAEYAREMAVIFE